MTINVPGNSSAGRTDRFDFDSYDKNRDGKLNEAEAKTAQNDGWNVKTGLHKSIWNETEVTKKEESNSNQVGNKSLLENLLKNFKKV